MPNTFAAGEAVEFNEDALAQLHFHQRRGQVLFYENDKGTLAVVWAGGITESIHQDWLRRPTTRESETLRLAGHLEDDGCPLEAAGRD